MEQLKRYSAVLVFTHVSAEAGSEVCDFQYVIPEYISTNIHIFEEAGIS
jgi:hypothetical protein